MLEYIKHPLPNVIKPTSPAQPQEGLTHYAINIMLLFPLSYNFLKYVYGFPYFIPIPENESGP
jgi:hypothetical protein